MATQRHLLFLAVALTMVSFLYPMAVFADKGTATFYKSPYVPSACNEYEDDGVMIAAASDEFWDNGDACGRQYTVKCISGTNKGVAHPCIDGSSVVVTIVDYCPSGCHGTIDLSKEAFSSIADTDAGKINVEYDRKNGGKRKNHMGLQDNFLSRILIRFSPYNLRCSQELICRKPFVI